MRKILTLLASIILIFNVGTKVIACGKENNKVLLDDVNPTKDKTFHRYDSLNSISLKNLNESKNLFLNFIDKHSDKIKDKKFKGKNFKTKDLIKDLFTTENFLINENNKYENFLNNTKNNNIQTNLLGISFPMNYNGVYFPWWGFGDYFYWYMSSTVFQNFKNLIGTAGGLTLAAIAAFLPIAGFVVSGPILPLLTLAIVWLVSSFAIAVTISNNINKIDDDGNGIYLGISILPTPTVFEFGKQDDCISEVNSFQVDYDIIEDYITVCVDAQGINYLLNYYSYKHNNVWTKDKLINDFFMPFLKKLKKIDHTGLGGWISDKDYTRWIEAFMNNDSFCENSVYCSRIKSFTHEHSNFKSIDIRTRRHQFLIKDFSKTWEIWKNN